jgi:ABC-type cobalt transport system substrate-binding protein
MTNKTIHRMVLTVLLVAALYPLSGSKEKEQAGEARPPEVEVVAVEQKYVPIYRDWVGTLEGEAGGKPSSPRSAMYSTRQEPSMNVEYRI